MSRLVINGWECWVREDGTRQILEKATLATMTWSFESGVGAAAHGVPTAVLGWLIKPLLRTAYAEGWADRNGQLDGAAMPAVYEDQS